MDSALKLLERPSIWKASNGVMYLCIERGVKVGRTLGAKFVVNDGKEVRMVFLDEGTIASRQLTDYGQNNLLPVLNRLLHPLSSSVSMDPVVRGILNQIIDKEAEMAKTKAAETTATAEAPKKEKFAKAGNGKAPAAAKDKAAASADHKPPMSEDDLKKTELYQAVVITSGKGAEANEGSFFKHVHLHAEKPIKLGDLIDKLIKDEKLVLKSEKPRETVIRVRTRDAFTRLGYLQEAPGAKK